MIIEMSPAYGEGMAFTAFRQAGSLLGVALSGALVAGGHSYRGFHLALGLSPAVLAVSAVLIRPRRPGGGAH